MYAMFSIVGSRDLLVYFLVFDFELAGGGNNKTSAKR